MAYTTPRTWVTGETVTAAQLNTDIRDNMGDVYARANAAQADADTAQATADSATALATSNYNQTSESRNLGDMIIQAYADLTTFSTSFVRLGEAVMFGTDLNGDTGATWQFRVICMIRVAAWPATSSVAVTGSVNRLPVNGTSGLTLITNYTTPTISQANTAPYAARVDSGWIDVTKGDYLITLGGNISFTTARPTTGAAYFSVFARTRV